MAAHQRIRVRRQRIDAAAVRKTQHIGRELLFVVDLFAWVLRGNLQEPRPENALLDRRANQRFRIRLCPCEGSPEVGQSHHETVAG